MNEQIWLQQVQEQMRQIEEYLSNLNINLEELENLKENLTQVQDVEEGAEILAPVATGIFIKAKAGKTTKLLVNIGNNIITEKTIPETIKLLEKQEEDLKIAKENAEKTLAELSVLSTRVNEG